jgi:hypothetical protein
VRGTSCSSRPPAMTGRRRSAWALHGTGSFKGCCPPAVFSRRQPHQTQAGTTPSAVPPWQWCWTRGQRCFGEGRLRCGFQGHASKPPVKGPARRSGYAAGISECTSAHSVRIQTYSDGARPWRPGVGQ